MAISVRPIRPSDEAAYRNILERTTDEDRYCRFFHVVDHFDPAEVHRYVEECSDTIGFIALDDGVPLGSVHAVAIDARTAELAIVVAHDARKRGVGRALIEALTAEIRRRGTHRLIALSLSQNTAFAKLAKSTGFVIERSEGATLFWQYNPAAATLAAQVRRAQEQPV
jgi:acetyltransferase